MADSLPPLPPPTRNESRWRVPSTGAAGVTPPPLRNSSSWRRDEPRLGRDPALLLPIILIVAVGVVGWTSLLGLLGVQLPTAIDWPPLGASSSPAVAVAVASATSSLTATPTETATPEPSVTPTPTEEPSPTPSPSASLSPTPEATPTLEPTSTVPATATALPATSTPALATPTPPRPSPSPTATNLPPVVRHMVAAGESLASIAARYGVDAGRIAAANRLPGGGTVFVGQTLLVPRIPGLVHIVGPGESLVAIARLYGVSVEAIVDANGLPDPGVLSIGQPLFIPGGAPAAPAPPTSTVGTLPRLPTAPSPAPPQSSGALTSSVVRGSLGAGSRAAPMVWPSRRVLSQGYGEEGHTGIDIMVDPGEPVVAAAAGVVTVARESDFGYGWRVEIDHGDVSTLYAHLSAFTVKPGDRVIPGQRIGLVGSTGSSTGPHLHFEVRRAGVPVDPLPYLP